MNRLRDKAPMGIPAIRLLRLIGLLVPRPERRDWVNEWAAELHSRWGLDGQRRRSTLSAHLHCLGAFEDALRLRIRRRHALMIAHDVRFAWRSFLRNPVFTLTILTTLALGIGANTAIFSLVDVVLLRPLPIEQPESLADVYTTCRRGFQYCSSSYPDFVDYKERSRSFSDMAAFSGTQVVLERGEGAELITAMLVTGSYFQLLGVPSMLGRTILPADDRLGQPETVAILSHRAWQERFGADPKIVGATVRINQAPFTIVGVAPPGFRGTRLGSDPDAWIPFTTYPLIDGTENRNEALTSRGMRWIYGVIGRRNAGVTIEQARADMAAVSDQLEEEDPRRAGRQITVEPTRTYTLPVATTGDDLVRFVLVLMAVVGASLLIACANAASLMLARASARRQEIGVRVALGADQRVLARQMLTESLLLSTIGALIGISVAAGALKLFAGYALPGGIPIGALDIALDTRVLAFTGVLSVVTGIAFGLVPAIQATNPSIVNALRDDPRRGAAPRMLRTREWLLTFQTALALVLLIGAGLFVRSLRSGLKTDVGFETRRLALAAIDLPMHRYTAPQIVQFLDDLRERVEHLPGVASVTHGLRPPLAQGGNGFLAIVDSYSPAPDEEIRIEADFVGTDYVRTLGIPLRGRDFVNGDRVGSRLVGIINETMARRYWPDSDALGSTLSMLWGPDNSAIEVIGIAGDVKDGLTENPEPFIYFPLAQHPARSEDAAAWFMAATPDDAINIVPQLRREIQALDSDIGISELTTLDNRFAEMLMPQRMGSMLLSLLGALTVVLAVVGIAGIVTYTVNQRKHEIGVRMALGASVGSVLRLLVTAALKPVVVGILLGVVAALTLTRLVSSFLLDVQATDTLTFIGIPILLASLAALAAFLPALRASAIHPTQALKTE